MYLPAIFMIFLIPLSSCDSDSTNFPSQYFPIDDNSFNIAYEDSILFNSLRDRISPYVQIGAINGTGIRTLCDTLISYRGSWSPNKRKIIFIGANTPLNGEKTNKGLYQIDLKNYKIIRLVPQDSLIDFAVYSPDMKLIAYATREPNRREQKIKIYNLTTGIVTDGSDWLNYPIYSLSWSPDSKQVLMDHGFVVDINTKSLSILFSIPNGQILYPAWSPDGTKVSFAGINGQWSNIYIHDLTTSQTRLLYGYPGFQYFSSWSKDGQRIIFDQRPASGINIITNSYLCKINVDGSNFIQITDSTEDYNAPCWYK